MNRAATVEQNGTDEQVERIRVEPPPFKTVEDVLTWAREEFATGGKARVVDVRGKSLETLIYGLTTPLQIVTPFGCIVIKEKA